MRDKPNILFIIADQHNAKVLGHKGHPDVQTPHLDRMAAEGVRFDNAITQNPICTPSRVSFLSGQYCHNHGYYGLSGPNPGGLPNIFGHFRQAGYATTAIGKIHCPEYWVEDQCDVFHETCGCSVGGRSPAYSQFLRERGKNGLEDHGGLTEFGARGNQSMEGRPSPLSFEEAQEGWIAQQAIAEMKRAAEAGRPFLVHTSLPRPHQCTAPAQEFWDLYEGKELTLPGNADYDMEGKAPGICSDAITRVPFIWWGLEGFAAGHAAEEIVELVDVPNTLCSLAGLDLLETADGRDISHLLRGESGQVRRVGVTEFAWSKSLRKGRFRYIHYPPEMFAREYPEGFGELYDLEADPWEMDNLFFDPAFRDVVAEMRLELLDWLVETARPGTVLQANSGGRPGMALDAQRIGRYHCVTNRDGKIHPDRLREIAGGNYL